MNTKSIGYRFIHLGRYDMLYVVTFTLVKRKFIYEFLKAIRSDSIHNKDVDLYFVIQKLYIQSQYKEKPTFIAVFEFTKKYHSLVSLLSRIGMCHIISIKQKMVQALFSQMSHMSFRQYSMFDRLKLSGFFGQKMISNPFARAILQKNVLHINNLEEKNYFQDYQYQAYITKRKYKRFYNQRPKQQEQMQKALFGQSFTNFQVYICQRDKQKIKKSLRKKYCQNQKMEDCVSTMGSDVQKMDSQIQEEQKIVIGKLKGMMIEEIGDMESYDSSSSSSGLSDSGSSNESDSDLDTRERYKLSFKL